MRIAALGDSITFGYPTGRSWTELVAERLEVEVLNFGVSGDTLDGMLARLETQVLPARPDYCIVMGGANDAFMGDDAETLLDGATRLADRLESRSVAFAFGLTPPVLLDSLEHTLARYRTGLRERGYPCIDFASVFYDPQSRGRVLANLLPDGVHPSWEGNVRMAEAAVAFLSTSLLSD